MGKIICPSCGEELDKVVLSFGTRSWDELSQSYVHTEADEEGDWACPKCGAGVSETRFYPPTTDGLPGKPLPEALIPFPKTFGDWVDLAENIKTADPDLAYKVNYNLGLIMRDLPGSEDAKRWLTRKAGELEIG